MSELFISAFVTFLVVIDPPGCAPIFASLTSGAAADHRRSMAIRSVLIATGILLFFALLGEELLDALGISLSAFRIAGGIMLFLIAIASVMLLMARSEGLQQSLLVLGALFATLALTLLALLLAGPLMRLLGNKMEAMITRLLGVILAALAAQFVIDGIERSFS